MPKNVENKDDTVLENVRFDGVDGNETAENLDLLTPEQSTCILAATWLRIREDPIVELRFELVDALINKVCAIN